MISEIGPNERLSSFDAIHYLQFEPSIFIGPLIFPHFFYEDAFLSPKMLILVLLFWIASKNPDVLTDKHNIDHKRKILNISLLRSVLADFGWFWISAGNRVRIEISWRIYFIWIFYIKYYINIFLYKWFKTCGVREDLWQAIPPWPLKFPFFFEGS